MIHVLDLAWIDPLEDASLIEHLTEFALVVALFASGLAIGRPLRWREWRAVAGLLGLVMPLTIAAGAAFGAAAMTLSLGAAITLGAILAPTDPVLAGTVGLGPPGDDREESDARFTLTAEAALNDGLVSPFVLLGVFILDRQGSGWLGEWAGGRGSRVRKRAGSRPRGARRARVRLVHQVGAAPPCPRA